MRVLEKGKLFATQAFSFNLPSCKSSFIHIYSLIRYTDISRLLFSSTCVALTNRYISWPSLCHLSPGSSMVRASHRRSEGCGFDPRLGLRNISLSLRQSLSSKWYYTFKCFLCVFFILGKFLFCLSLVLAYCKQENHRKYLYR